MDEQEALAAYAGGDEARAGQAYDWLCRHSRPFLHAYLKLALTGPQDREDIIQTVHLKLWKYRPHFTNRGVAAWYGLLKRTADRCLFDRAQEERKDNWLSIEDLPDDQLPLVEEFMTKVAEVVRGGVLFHYASILWLGLDPDLPPEVHHRQLLAAQLYYLDGAPWEEVLDVLAPPGPPGPSAPAMTRELLDRWLSHPGVLCYLAYHTLYRSNDELASHLLQLPEPRSPAALDALMRRALVNQSGEPGPAGWSWGEVAVLLWRYRYGLLVEQIHRRADCPMTRSQMDALLVKSRALFPFSGLAAELLDQLERTGGVRAHRLFSEPGLWQRLAFQYRYDDELAHRDIHDRADPAARQIGCTLTLGMLNIWLSGGRLLRRLAEFNARRPGVLSND